MGRRGVRNSRYKVKNRTRDIDQISNDVKDENISNRINEATEPNEDLPALGQYFCVYCDKYFIDQATLDTHVKQKPHKRRLKSLAEPPHTQEDADLAAGISKQEYKIPIKKQCLFSDVSTTNNFSKPQIAYAYVE